MRIPIVGFRRAKSLKDILVRAKVAPLEKKKDSCRSCGGSMCEICKHVVTTEIFRSFSIFFHEKHVQSNTQEVLQVSDLDFNNYKSAHRNFIKGNTVKQPSFHAHFEDDKHHGMSDW